MKIRIFSASLFCVVLLSGCSTASIRPEVARPLQMAKSMSAEGKFSDAVTELQIAEAVPNQNFWEKLAVASTVNKFRGNTNEYFSPEIVVPQAPDQMQQ